MRLCIRFGVRFGIGFVSLRAVRLRRLCLFSVNLSRIRLFTAARAGAFGLFRFGRLIGFRSGGIGCLGLCRGSHFCLRTAQGVVEARDLALYQTFNVFEVLFVPRDADHDCLAITSRATRAADPVHVILGMGGHVVVIHVADRRHIKAARGHVRGNKEAQIAVAEPFQCFGPLALIKIPMDRSRVIAVFFQRLSDRIHIHLAVAEDDRVGAFVAFGVDQRTQHFAFFRRFAVLARGFEHQHALLDILARGGLTGHFDTLGRREEGVRNPLDLGGHRGREEQRLTGKGRHLEDAFDIGDEPHIQHPVGFVHDHDLHVGQDQLAALKMVDQTAGRGDQNVNALVDQLVLLSERHTADQQRFGQFQVLGIGVEVLGHLCRQFPRGAQHQTARHPGAGAATGKQGDHGQGKAGSFAGACLGDSQDILAFKGRGDRAGLNRRGGFIPGLINGFQDFRIKV